jgi:hypothetical protein
MACAKARNSKSTGGAKGKKKVAANKRPAHKPRRKKDVVQEWIYALDPAKIKVNDIILISDDEWGSKLSRFGSQSDYGHVALCTRPGMLFEAVLTGVMRRSVIGTFATRSDWIRVLRPRETLGANAQGLEVAYYAERMYGRPYSLIRAGFSVIDRINISDNGSTFCSRVVAEAYHDYGIDLVPGKLPSKVHPSMLLKSPALCDVTEQSIRKLGSVSHRHLFEEIVSIADQESPGDEMQMNRRVFKAIRRKLGAALPRPVLTLPDLWKWLATDAPEARAADATILEVLNREGFVDWYASWAQGVADQAQLFENIAKLAERAGFGPMTPDLELFSQQIREYLALDDTSLTARAATRDEFAQLAGHAPLSCLVYLRDKYLREYTLFERLNIANKRLLGAVIKATLPPT